MKEIIVLIMVLILFLSIGSLIFWGIGNLIIFVFKINYEWTILHGLVSQIIFMILRNIFKNNN